MIWSQQTYILRAYSDGSGVQVLAVVPPFAVEDVEVDPKMSLVYWTNEMTIEIFQCDLEGKNLEKLNLSVQRQFTVFDNIIYWLNTSSKPAAVYRADVRKPEKQLVFMFTGSISWSSDLEILPLRDAVADTFENPCANNSCSHICVQSNNHVGYTCLCPVDYVLDRDGHNCTLGKNLTLTLSLAHSGRDRLKLLVSVTFSFPISLSNTSTVTAVLCSMSPGTNHTINSKQF